MCMGVGGGGGGWRSKRHPVFGVRVQDVILRNFCAIVVAAHAVADSRERVPGVAANLRQLHKYNTARALILQLYKRAQHCSVECSCAETVVFFTQHDTST